MNLGGSGGGGGNGGDGGGGGGSGTPLSPVAEDKPGPDSDGGWVEVKRSPPQEAAAAAASQEEFDDTTMNERANAEHAAQPTAVAPSSPSPDTAAQPKAGNGALTCAASADKVLFCISSAGVATVCRTMTPLR